MVNKIHLLITILVIVLFVPQTPIDTENILLRVLNQTNFFTSYGETQSFLNRLNWILIAVFLTITFFAGLSYS